jgi:hypothetical protein
VQMWLICRATWPPHRAQLQAEQAQSLEASVSCSPLGRRAPIGTTRMQCCGCLPCRAVQHPRAAAPSAAAVCAQCWPEGGCGGARAPWGLPCVLWLQDQNMGSAQAGGAQQHPVRPHPRGSCLLLLGHAHGAAAAAGGLGVLAPDAQAPVVAQTAVVPAGRGRGRAGEARPCRVGEGRALTLAPAAAAAPLRWPAAAQPPRQPRTALLNQHPAPGATPSPASTPNTPAPGQLQPQPRRAPDLLQALQVVAQLGVQGRGGQLAVAAVLVVLLPAGWWWRGGVWW